jgi:hypothetical protein
MPNTPFKFKYKGRSGTAVSYFGFGMYAVIWDGESSTDRLHLDDANV